MLSKKLRRIVLEYYQKYQREGINITLSQLIRKAEAEVKKSEDNYLKLRPPKTAPKEIYLNYWVREVLDKDFSRKTVIPIDYKNPPPEPYFQALVAYFSFLPLELIQRINQEINNTAPAERIEVWKSFNLPIKEIEAKFTKLILARKNYFLKKEKMTLLEFYKKHFAISEESFQSFVRNKDKIIELCNQLLPDTSKLPSWFYSELNLPCFICRLSKFPLGDFQQTVNFIFKKYSCFSVFKPKVKIRLGEITSVKYEKMSDSFLITIDKYANPRHQLMSLLHELSHVIIFLKNFQSQRDPFQEGKYFQEKNTIEIEFSLLQDLSEDLFRANLSEILLNFRTTIFEIELYKNPTQDIDRLYAHTFNQCFKGAKQKKNQFYILNEKIITAPFSSLPYTVAYSEILRKKFLHHHNSKKRLTSPIEM